MFKTWILIKKFFDLYIFLLSCVFFINVNFDFVKCDQWEYKLVHHILKDYDASIRPSLRHNATLNVTFGLALAQLIDVVSIVKK
jgi:hypothetical protein